jgi:GlcNAc-P-P-Und epimerase
VGDNVSDSVGDGMGDGIGDGVVMRVLVIGGSGFIGTRLIDVLRAHGHDVSNLDIRPSNRFPELTTIGDVRDLDAVTKASAEHDVIVNLAAEHRDDVRPVSLYESVNVDGARVVTQAAETNGVTRIVFTSTVAVYGLGKVNPDESTPLEPFNEYGRTKRDAENVLRTWADADPARVLAIVRPTVVFGEANRGNVYTLIRQIASRLFVMIGRGANRKSMAYVGNVAAFVETRLANPPGVEIVNYADKPDFTVRELVMAVRSTLRGRPSKVGLALPYWLGLAIGFVFDGLARVLRKPLPISSVRVRKFCAETSIATPVLAATGFVPPYDMREALDRTILAEFGPGAQPSGSDQTTGE